MLEGLLQMYNINEFAPLYDYIKNLDNESIILVNDYVPYGTKSRIIQLKINDILFELKVLEKPDKKWLSLCRYNGQNEKIEVIDFLIYSYEYIKNSYEKVNRFITYSAIKYEKNIAKTINYTYTYIDNHLIFGWKKKRTISYEDGHRLATIDSLDNLSFNIEQCGVEVYEKSDERVNKVKKLEFFY